MTLPRLLSGGQYFQKSNNSSHSCLLCQCRNSQSVIGTNDQGNYFNKNSFKKENEKTIIKFKKRKLGQIVLNGKKQKIDFQIDEKSCNFKFFNENHNENHNETESSGSGTDDFYSFLGSTVNESRVTSPNGNGCGRAMLLRWFLTNLDRIDRVDGGTRIELGNICNLSEKEVHDAIKNWKKRHLLLMKKGFAPKNSIDDSCLEYLLGKSLEEREIKINEAVNHIQAGKTKKRIVF